MYFSRVQEVHEITSTLVTFMVPLNPLKAARNLCIFLTMLIVLAIKDVVF